jgi:hypothetical protein
MLNKHCKKVCIDLMMPKRQLSCNKNMLIDVLLSSTEDLKRY